MQICKRQIKSIPHSMLCCKHFRLTVIEIINVWTMRLQEVAIVKLKTVFDDPSSSSQLKLAILFAIGSLNIQRDHIVDGKLYSSSVMGQAF